jgi:ribonuclease HI
MKKIFINTDGGARGNPGPAAIGVVFSDENHEVLHTYKEYIGKATNNEAEYLALIRACEILAKSKWFLENDGDGAEVVCRLDSQLVVEQVAGRYKIKQPRLQVLYKRFYDCVKHFNLKIYFKHVVREENKLADELVNQALDDAISKQKL